MIHFIPESPAAEIAGPYAEAVARLASISHALACVEQVAGNEMSQRDSEARLALGFHAASPPAKRCFGERSARVASAAAAGLEAIAGRHDEGVAPHPEALARLQREIGAGLDSIDVLFSL